jgi:hypothetical protein
MTQHQKAPPQKSNKNPKSLVKVVASTDVGKWCSPAAAATFEINGTPTFPTINFEIDTPAAGPYKWTWKITWNAKVSGVRESAKRGSSVRVFSETGAFDSDKKAWVADVGHVLGGVLTVEVKAGTELFRRSVTIKAANPKKDDVVTYLAAIADASGFDKILEQESHYKNVINADGQPIVAFDKGYGMTQMTHPAPTYEQCWSWKANIDAGVALYQTKQRSAKTYLGQAHRTYTAEQLKLETWSRWNGGPYHKWDDKAKAWVRNDDIMCDTETGNIGWKMSEKDNAGQSEDDLHDRDKASYGNPKKNKGEANKWIYTGACYADHLNAQ